MARFAETKINITSTNPSEIVLQYSPSEINKEYSRLRKVALKRLTRLENSKDFSAPQYAEYHRSEWQTIRELENVGNVAKALSSLTRFLNMRGSLVTEQIRMRKERREFLESEIFGRKFKSYREMNLFDDFLNYMSNLYNDKFYYDIENVRDLFDDYADKVLDGSMTIEDFAEEYERNYDNDIIIKKPSRARRNN